MLRPSSWAPPTPAGGCLPPDPRGVFKFDKCCTRQGTTLESHSQMLYAHRTNLAGVPLTVKKGNPAGGLSLEDISPCPRSIPPARHACVVRCVVTARSLPVSPEVAPCHSATSEEQRICANLHEHCPSCVTPAHSMSVPYSPSSELTRKRSMVRIHSGLPSVSIT